MRIIYLRGTEGFQSGFVFNFEVNLQTLFVLMQLVNAEIGYCLFEIKTFIANGLSSYDLFCTCRLLLIKLKNTLSIWMFLF